MVCDYSVNVRHPQARRDILSSIYGQNTSIILHAAYIYRTQRICGAMLIRKGVGKAGETSSG